MLQGDVVAVLKPAAKLNQGSNLLFRRFSRPLFSRGIILAVEIANDRDSQVGIVAFCVRPLAAFRPPALHAAVTKNDVMISRMVNMTKTGDFEPARLVIFVYIALAPRQGVFTRDECRVVNHDPGRHDRVKKRCARIDWNSVVMGKISLLK